MRLWIVVVCALTASAIDAICQEKPDAQRLHVIASKPGLGALLAADSIERDAPSLKWTPSVIHMRGNVEIRKPVTLSLPKIEQEAQDIGTPAGRVYLVVRADEADYDEQTGEIVPRGNVHISFQSVR